MVLIYFCGTESVIDFRVETCGLCLLLLLVRMLGVLVLLLLPLMLLLLQ